MTLTPAYGRDYSSRTAVRQDWDDNKDFLIADVTDRWCGKPINREQVQAAGISEVSIRYAAVRKVATFAVEV